MEAHAGMARGFREPRDCNKYFNVREGLLWQPNPMLHEVAKDLLRAGEV